MEKFIVFFREIRIGMLEINDENLYKYTPETENLPMIQTQLAFPKDLSTSTEWVEPIPFFKNRIENCKRFMKKPREIGYKTDEYRLVLVTTE